MSSTAFQLRRPGEDRKERSTMTASRTAGRRLARVHHLVVPVGVLATGDVQGDVHPTFSRRTS
jgi:hypothetical protein